MRDPKILLTAEEMPRQWYNLAADLPAPPPLGPDGQPVGPDALAPVFPMNLIEQEVCQDRWIDIPDGILELLARWRPSPLRRAYALEKTLGTPAKIYYKDESVSPAGSHKPNTAVAQAWYNREFGIERLCTETGAGQWGCALAYSCALVGLECRVFMVKVSFNQKPFRKVMMETWGGSCVASPSEETETGRAILAEDPDSPGSLGIAISEAIEAAVTDLGGKTRYSLGSVLNHVLLHQTVIGLEAKKQLDKAGEGTPDVVIGCAGGGSNFAGIAFPFVADKINGAEIEILPVEPEACPTLTRGPYAYDHGDTAEMTPLMPMHSLGHKFIPPTIHAGGLRYHGIAPLVSASVEQGLMSPRAYGQHECYEAAVRFARTEGLIVAPETSHAVAAVIDEAERAKEEGREKTILFCLSGHGLLDLKGYEKFFAGDIENYPLPEEVLARSIAVMEGHPKP
jgi:tryptophan synthase beta chain